VPWRYWKPELNCDKTLQEVLDTMPRDPANKIPWQVKMFENPGSPLAIPGAIDLFGHDCLHALLCTSFYTQCEAWTIGFTMGTCDGLKDWHINLLKLWSRSYPGEYRLGGDDLHHLDEGIAFGRRAARHESRCRNINQFNFRDPKILAMKMSDLREMFGLDWIDEDHEYQDWALKRWSDKPLMSRCPYEDGVLEKA
tara:strand:+ start:29044 stop:29631 length:588 start_codon:yes stop_codon:yes gene_type:complete